MTKTTLKNPRRKQAAKPQPSLADVLPIGPNNFYRMSDGPRFFGYKLSQLDIKIRQGLIPAPVMLSDNGRAVGWLGQTILDWQASRVAKLAKHMRDAVAS